MRPVDLIRRDWTWLEVWKCIWYKTMPSINTYSRTIFWQEPSMRPLPWQLFSVGVYILYIYIYISSTLDCYYCATKFRPKLLHNKEYMYVSTMYAWPPFVFSGERRPWARRSWNDDRRWNQKSKPEQRFVDSLRWIVEQRYVFLLNVVLAYTTIVGLTQPTHSKVAPI